MDAFSLGRYLRETRKAQERTLDDAVHQLKIRRVVLERFEQGVFRQGDLAEVQERGFLRTYARYLGLDDDQILQVYTASQVDHSPTPASRKRQTQVTSPAPSPNARLNVTETNPSPPKVTVNPASPTTTMMEQMDARVRRRTNWLNRFALGMVALAALSIIFFVSYQLLREPVPAITLVELPAILPSITPSPFATLIPTTAPLQALQEPTKRAPLSHDYSGQGVLVTILAQQRTWIRVVADGQEEFVGMMPPDAVVEQQAFERIEISATNAAALLITYNGEAQRLVGGRGQAVELVFTRERMDILSDLVAENDPALLLTAQQTPTLDVGALILAQTPTSTEGPSPTPTLTPTVTLTPTITLTPSLTPSSTPTVGPTPTITLTPSSTPTLTPSQTLEPTQTFTPTAVLPLRLTPSQSTPVKSGT
ncbi:MAG UNVERIFIED_CONTAM: DUF4115 domain-containing protein [Anaerolineae bacterium]